MAYGYRVFKFTVHEGLGRQPLDLADSTAPIGPSLHGALTKLVASQLLLGTPEGRNPLSIKGEAKLHAQAARVLSADSHAGRLTAQWVAGKRGDSDWLIETNEDISSKASGHELRIDFLLPKSGTVGLIVAEVRGRTMHLPPAVRWIGHATATRASGQPVRWLRIQADQVVDSTYLGELMAKAQNCEVEFEESGVIPSGKARTRKFTVKGFDAATLQALAEEASNWGPGSNVQAKTDRLKKVLGVKSKKLEKADVVLSAPVLRIQPTEGPQVRWLFRVPVGVSGAPVS